MRIRNLILIISLIITIISLYYLQHNRIKHKRKILALKEIVAEPGRALLPRYKFATQDLIKTYENDLSTITKEDFLLAKEIASQEEKVKFCVVIPSYNNVNYATQNINSVFRQNYHNWRAIIIDDGSNDGMSELLVKIKQDSNLPDEKLTILRHETRIRSALYSFYEATHNFCKDDEVLVMLDGDDMLATSSTLKQLASVYEDSSIWVTYGQQLDTNGTPCNCSDEIPKEKWPYIRKLPFTTSHLRTCYTWLFNQIALKDLQYQGEFLNSGWDLAIMYPILEMAGKARVKAMDHILYIWRTHENNDGKIYSQEQKELTKYISSLPKYKQLD
ncbi:MAG: glycosyltransferase family A protein [Pseudomonadota bacterium]|mgnify:CR=1 FL=1